MTVEPERTPRRNESRRQETGRRETQAQPQSRQNSRHNETPPATPTDDTSEMLRWRADQLLDEMMIGGIDVSAADLDGSPPVRQDEETHSLQQNGHHHNEHDSNPVPRLDEDHGWDDSGWNDRGWHDAGANGRAWGKGQYHDASERDAARHQDNEGATPERDFGAHAESSAAESSAAGSESAGPDLDVYFDAYESSYSTRRPARKPAQNSAQSSTREQGDRAWNGQSSSASTDSARPDANHASSPFTGTRAADPRALDSGDRDRRGEDMQSDSHTGDSHTGDAMPGDVGRRDAGRTRDSAGRPYDSGDSLLSSKINETDYLSRRYGYVDGDGEHKGEPDIDPTFEHDFDEDMERALGEPKPSQAAGVSRTRDNSRTYYERQRVNREERMRSAEHRPEPPMRSDGARSDAQTDLQNGMHTGARDSEDAGVSFGNSVAGKVSSRESTAPEFTARESRGTRGYRDESRGDEWLDGDSTRHERSARGARTEPPRAEPYRQDTYRQDAYGERAAREEPARTYRPELLHEELSMESQAQEEPEAEDTEWIHQAKEKWNWQDVSGISKRVEPFQTSGAETLHEFELAGYDRDPNVRREPSTGQAGSAVGAMAMANGQKRSNLLPRMSATSVERLQQQIDELLEQITLMLPEGHEYHQRAHHLLDKAVSILQSDPTRSAEVEYYMQQVRGIVQRQEQANLLSNMYRERLQRYLGAWTAFSVVVLLARYIFQFEFDAFLAGTFSLDYSGFLLQNAAGFTGAVFAGALGASVGALLTLMRHARLPYGFVDRKYGLRGLILPLIGFLAGGIIYLPFGFFYYMIGLDPSLNMIAASIAAVCAFAFGFNQEAIYGTRE